MYWILIQMRTLPVLLGFCLDLLIGDPAWLYHPIRLVGKLIAAGERIIRGLLPQTKAGERAGGILLVVVVVGVTAAVPGLALYFLYRVSVPAGLVLETIFCTQVLAAKCLRDESLKVWRRLVVDDLAGARKAVSYIVGRDTEALSREGVTRAAVETVAENGADGEIAPLFYLMLGGAVAGWIYKAVNTMDSMVGYRNDRYRYFGTAAARLDDVLNFIPSRLAALFMIAGAGPAGLDRKNALRIYKRDRRHHESPNSAQTESVMAGALEIELMGNAIYGGVLKEKPTLGDAAREADPGDILRASRLMYIASALAFVTFAVIRCAVLLVWHGAV